MTPPSPVRRLLLIVLLFGMGGTLTDLLLLAHYEDSAQLIPLVLLGAALGAALVHLLRPTVASVRALQGTMALVAIAAVAGIGFHFNGAAEFQLEIDPSQTWWDVTRKAVRAQSPPILAPGAMLQLGLLGLVYTFRHPAIVTVLPSRTEQMTPKNRFSASAAIAIACLAGTLALAQVGKGLIDPNVASEKELLSLPHMSPAIVTAMMARRPFAGIAEWNAFLLGQKLTPEQAADVYRRAFVHVNLNTGTREEILLIPSAGTRMAREFDEYRPWRNWAHFDKEIGKYVSQDEVNRLKQYVFIPVNLNTASDDDILSIPGAGPRMVREFKEYRPWKTKAQFEKEIGKYVDAKEVARLWRYVVIQ